MKTFSGSVIGGIAVISVVLEVSGESMQMNRNWLVVNDGVMGGLSQSRAEKLPDGSIKFSGVISFENNGGFASIRHSGEMHLLNDSSGIRLKIKGDGKTYQFRVRTS